MQTIRIIFLKLLINLCSYSSKPPKSSLGQKMMSGDKQHWSLLGNFTPLKLTSEVLLILAKTSSNKWRSERVSATWFCRPALRDTIHRSHQWSVKKGTAVVGTYSRFTLTNAAAMQPWPISVKPTFPLVLVLEPKGSKQTLLQVGTVKHQ